MAAFERQLASIKDQCALLDAETEQRPAVVKNLRRERELEHTLEHSCFANVAGADRVRVPPAQRRRGHRQRQDSGPAHSHRPCRSTARVQRRSCCFRGQLQSSNHESFPAKFADIAGPTE